MKIFVGLIVAKLGRTVFVDFDGGVDNLVNSLFGDSGSKDDREVGERSKLVTDSVFEVLDGVGAFVFDEVPLVDAYDEPFVVFVDKREDVGVLTFDATSCVNHEDADVGIFDCSDATNHGVVFDVFVHLVFLAVSLFTF